MILSLFRTNQLFTAVFLLFYIAILQLAPIWIDDNWTPSAHGVFAERLYAWIGEKGTIPQIVTGFLLFIQAFIIVYIDFTHKLSRESTLFTGIFLIIFSSMAVPLLHLAPNHCSNIFLLLGINEILGTYRDSNASGKIFNAGFFIGVAALFTPSYLIFIIWIFAGLNLMRGFNLKERIMVLAGVFAAYFLVATYYFWNNDLASFWIKQFHEGFAFFDFRSGNFFTFIHLGLVMTIVVLILLFRGGLMTKKVMQEQKKIDIFYWGLLISALVVLFQGGIQENHILVLMPFIGLFMGMQFSTLKYNVAELLHLLLIIMALFLQYRPLFLT